MPTLDEMKRKYDPVFKLMAKGGVRLDHLHIQDNKMVMTGAACSEDLRNQVWNAIKGVDASYSDLSCDMAVDTSLPAPPPDAQTYTIAPGDSLWKIAEKFYGNGALYKKILAANPNIKDENKIGAGDHILIPPA